MRFSIAAVIFLACAAVTGGGALRAPQSRPNLGRLDTTNPIPFFIDDGRGIKGYAPPDRDLAKAALNAWSRESGGKLRFVEAKNADEALVHVEWSSPDQGLFGVTQRTLVGGKAGAIVFVIPQVEGLGQPLAGQAAKDPLLRDTIVYLTCVHELGHAVGLPHTDKFEDIMYSFGYGGDILAYFMRYRMKLNSRSDIDLHSGLSDADVEFLRSLYAD